MSAMIGRCLRTKEISQSLLHYEQVLEFRVEQVDETREMAVIVAQAGEPIVLAGMTTDDWSEYLADRYDASQPGQNFYLSAIDTF